MACATSPRLSRRSLARKATARHVVRCGGRAVAERWRPRPPTTRSRSPSRRLRTVQATRPPSANGSEGTATTAPINSKPSLGLILRMTGGVASFNGLGNINFLAAQNCNQAIINSSTYTWKGDWWVGDLFSYSHTHRPTASRAGMPTCPVVPIPASRAWFPRLRGTRAAPTRRSATDRSSSSRARSTSRPGTRWNEEWERGDQRRFLLIDRFSRWA